ncbi:unnamed protein product [Thlaspi arvense]|uniref:Uncharacterized protein n=1 Tax=Thlaspi arvense TaxID=13288 RepID=A0AAU9SAJ1_THLAR|nr:unnamed protein product [Thlaspi arvense]
MKSEDQKFMSRRQWMTCVCLTPALINNAYTFVSVQSAAALDKKPGVCRNCQGIGAVICVAVQENGKLSTENVQKMYMSLQNVQTVTVYQTTKAFLEGLVLVSYSTRCTMVGFFPIHEQLVRLRLEKPVEDKRAPLSDQSISCNLADCYRKSAFKHRTNRDMIIEAEEN